MPDPDRDITDLPPRRRRPAFDPDYGPYLGRPGDPRNEDESEDDDESQSTE